MRFFNLRYKEGVQDFEKTVRVIDRREHYLIARGIDDLNRHYVIEELTFDWLVNTFGQAFIEQLRTDGLQDVQAALGAQFGRSPNY